MDGCLVNSWMDALLIFFNFMDVLLIPFVNSVNSAPITDPRQSGIKTFTKIRSNIRGVSIFTALKSAHLYRDFQAHA